MRPEFVGWGGLFPVTVYIENIIGMRFNAPEKTVTFEISEDRKCGLENFLFCGNKLSIVYENGKVNVKTEAPFTLILNGKRVNIEAGEQTVNI